MIYNHLEPGLFEAGRNLKTRYHSFVDLFKRHYTMRWITMAGWTSWGVLDSSSPCNSYRPHVENFVDCDLSNRGWKLSRIRSNRGTSSCSPWHGMVWNPVFLMDFHAGPSSVIIDSTSPHTTCASVIADQGVEGVCQEILPMKMFAAKTRSLEGCVTCPPLIDWSKSTDRIDCMERFHTLLGFMGAFECRS